MKDKKQNKLFTRTLRKMLKLNNVRRSKNGYLRYAARKLGATPPVIDRNSRARQAIPVAVGMAIKEARRHASNG